MKIYPKADQAQDDTIEYMFANVNCCMFDADKQCLMLEYSRGDYGVTRHFRLEQLDLVKPGLAEVIVGFYNRFSNTVPFSRHAAAACAFASGSYIDLNASGSSDESYPFICGIRYIRSTAQKDVFLTDCRPFRVVPDDFNKFPRIVASDDQTSLISAHVLEKLFPGCVHDVLTMESLGCSDSEIVKNLFTRPRQSEMTVHLNDVQFD